MPLHRRLRATAYHEAGHAVAAYMAGRRFTQVSVVPDDWSLGRCTFASLRLYPLNGDGDHRGRARIEREIMIFCGGSVAEALHMRRSHSWRWAKYDLIRALELAEWVTHSREEANAYTSWLLKRSEALLREQEWRRAVSGLASDLMRYGELGEHDARAAISTAVRRHRRLLRERASYRSAKPRARRSR
jgi:hypothetical protein